MEKPKKKSANTELEKRLKKIIKQISGSVDEDHGELIPEVAIAGKGVIFCYSAIDRTLVAINRGTKAFVVYENYGYSKKALIYTLERGHLVEIEKEELIYTRFD
jgi:hypothetical protein